MSKRFAVLFSLASAVLLAACSGTPVPVVTAAVVTLPPVVTEAPAVTLAPLPALTEAVTLAPVAATAAVAGTPAPASSPDVITALLPAGSPSVDWGGIPIMPGALSGSQDSYSYRFTIQATPDEVHAYYDQQLSKLGFQSLAVEPGQEQSTLLTYSNDSDQSLLTITLYPQGDVTLVMIVKT